MAGARSKCRCGKVVLHVSEKGCRWAIPLTCYCRDCRAFARYLAADSFVREHGGVALVQLRPQNVTLEGQSHLAALRLSPKGPIRWYAQCCDTPLGITPASPGFPFLSCLADNFDTPPNDRPQLAATFAEQALDGPGEKPKSFGIAMLVIRVIGRVAATTLSGKRKVSPFFDETGKPIVEPRILTRDERAAVSG